MKTRPLKREEFEGHFKGEVLERGRRYFEEDRVDDPIIVDCVVKTKVHGTATYSVEFNPDNMVFRCSCPYFASYGNCKHLAALLYRLADDPEVESLDETIRILEKKSKKELIALLKSIMRAEPKFRSLLTGDLEDLNREVRGPKDGFLDADPDLFVEKVASMRRLINLFEKPESLKLLKDLFVELRHMYCDFGGVEFLEDEMYQILETIAPELKVMDEGTRDGLMREIRAIYEEDDSVLKSFMYEPWRGICSLRDIKVCSRFDALTIHQVLNHPVTPYAGLYSTLLCSCGVEADGNKDNKIGGEHHHDALFVRPNFVLTL